VFKQGLKGSRLRFFDGPLEAGRLSKERKNTLRDSVFESLKAMIITGQIPPGGRVTENEIAERLKVSRTPVREAFNRDRKSFV